MKTPNRTLLLLFPFIALVGCVSSDVMRVGPNTYPPRPSDYLIDVYIPVEAPVSVQQSIADAKPMTDLPPDAEVVGRIDTNGAPAAGWGSVIANAKEKAREIGGDAIVITQWGTPLNGVGEYGETYYGKAISMKVVRLNQ